MRYLFAIYVDERAAAARSEAEMKAGVALHAPYIETLRANGRYRASEALGPSRSAVTLRNANGKPVVTQGPYAEAREHFGGFYVIDADHLDEAIDDAARNPALQTVGAAIEIRPIPDDGATEATAASPSSPDDPKFLLALYRDPAHEPDAAAFAAFGEHARKAGALVTGARLTDASSATTVRLRDGKPVLTDGPFAETREQLAGFFVVHARDLEAALALATACPDTGPHALEVRPVRRTET